MLRDTILNLFSPSVVLADPPFWLELRNQPVPPNLRYWFWKDSWKITSAGFLLSLHHPKLANVVCLDRKAWLFSTCHCLGWIPRYYTASFSMVLVEFKNSFLQLFGSYQVHSIYLVTVLIPSSSTQKFSKAAYAASKVDCRIIWIVNKDNYTASTID